MRSYEVRPFEPHHYIMLVEDPKSTYSMHGINSDPLAVAQLFKKHFGRSGFCNNELLVCAGVMLPWPGYGVAWALLSSNARKHPWFVHRAVKEGLQYFIKRLGLRRVEANVNEGLPHALKWVLKLGFEEESVMPKYGPRGETFRKFVIYG